MKVELSNTTKMNDINLNVNGLIYIVDLDHMEIVLDTQVDDEEEYNEYIDNFNNNLSAIEKAIYERFYARDMDGTSIEVKSFVKDFANDYSTSSERVYQSVKIEEIEG